MGSGLGWDGVSLFLGDWGAWIDMYSGYFVCISGVFTYACTFLCVSH